LKVDYIILGEAMSENTTIFPPDRKRVKPHEFDGHPVMSISYSGDSLDVDGGMLMSLYMSSDIRRFISEKFYNDREKCISLQKHFMNYCLYSPANDRVSREDYEVSYKELYNNGIRLMFSYRPEDVDPSRSLSTVLSNRRTKIVLDKPIINPLPKFNKDDGDIFEDLDTTFFS
jgi:hypothetical protein